MVLHFCPFRSVWHDETADTAAEPATFQSALMKPQLQTHTEVRQFSDVRGEGGWRPGPQHLTQHLNCSGRHSTVLCFLVRLHAPVWGWIIAHLWATLTCCVIPTARWLDEIACGINSIKLSGVTPEKEDALMCAPVHMSSTTAVLVLWRRGSCYASQIHLKYVSILHDLVWKTEKNSMC